MKPVVAILSHSGANATVQRHWPLYLNCGCDIVGIGRTDTHCQWPAESGQFIGSMDIGQESYAKGDNHICRFLELVEWFLTDAMMKSYTHLVVIEYDGVFFAPVPKLKINTFYGKLAGGKSDGFLGSMYIHTPWCMDRLCAGNVLKHGRAMLKAGLIEQGFLDRWFGLMIDLYDLQWRDTGAGTYTHNTLDTPEKIAEAGRAVAEGAWYVHGLKTAEQLRKLSHAIHEGLHRRQDARTTVDTAKGT